MRKIGIIGGQGKFGQKLSAALTNSAGDNFAVESTGSREDTARIAQEADILLIAVRPEQVLNTLRQLQPHLLREKEIISFAAAVSRDSMQEAAGQSVQRAMMDPGATFGMITADESTREFDSIFERIVTQKIVSATSDEQVDLFTATLSYLFTTSMWSQIMREGDDSWHKKHMEFIERESDLSKQEIESVLQDIKKKNSARSDLVEKATPGGVSESLLEALERSDEISAESLFEVGKGRIKEMRERLNRE